jgi:hypothetical protein
MGYRRSDTRVGSGAFIDIRASYRDATGDDLVRSNWTIFRYTPADHAGSGRRVSAVDDGADPVHFTEIGLDLQRLVMWAGVIRDFAPLHFDRHFARGAGARDAFANTQLLHALYERTLTEAFGPQLSIVRLGPFRMTGFATCGSVLRTFVSKPTAQEDGTQRVLMWQECDGQLTASGEASLVPSPAQPLRRQSRPMRPD